MVVSSKYNILVWAEKTQPPHPQSNPLLLTFSGVLALSYYMEKPSEEWMIETGSYFSYYIFCENYF